MDIVLTGLFAGGVLVALLGAKLVYLGRHDQCRRDRRETDRGRHDC